MTTASTSGSSTSTGRRRAKTKVTGPEKIAVAPYHYLCNGQLSHCVPQPGTDRRLDAQGDKLMARVVYRRVNGAESIVAVHSVNTEAAAGGVRWYEFRVDKDRSVKLHQQGTYAPDGFYRWMASPAIDKLGNIGIGYSFGGTPHFAGPAIRRTRCLGSARRAHAARNDPRRRARPRRPTRSAGRTTRRPPSIRSDDCTIWYVGDYYKKDATNYSTRIGAFRMPGCSGS